MRVTANVVGQYSVVTNDKKYIYEGIICDVITLNSSFTLHVRSAVGHTIIMPIQGFQNESKTIPLN